MNNRQGSISPLTTAIIALAVLAAGLLIYEMNRHVTPTIQAPEVVDTLGDGSSFSTEVVESDEADMFEEDIPANWSEKTRRQRVEEAKAVRLQDEDAYRDRFAKLSLNPALLDEFREKQLDAMVKQAEVPNTDDEDNSLTPEQIQELRDKGLMVW